MFLVLILAVTIEVAQKLRRGSSPSSKESLVSKEGIKLYNSMEAVPNVPTGIFDYGGAIDLAALQREGMNAAINRAHPQFRLRYAEPTAGKPGSSTGIGMLIDKQLSFAHSSRPLAAAEYAAAKKRGFELEAVPVAEDGIVFFVNPSLGIESLTWEQLKDIYRGKIDNWQQVGGADLPITPVSLSPQTNRILPLLLSGESTPSADEVKVVRDYTTAIRLVGANQRAIAYSSAAILRGQKTVRSIALAAELETTPVSALLADGTVNLQAIEGKIYPLSQQLYVIIRRDGTIEEEAGVAYVNFLRSQPGQELLYQAGFVPKSRLLE